MYNKRIIDSLVEFVSKYNGINDKSTLSEAAKTHFSLTQDRSVYYCSEFAIRFCMSKSKAMANTVLSLSTLQKYDNKPFIVCIVTPTENFLLLSNTSFLKRISHSSKELRVDNIKGSFNGTDIMPVYQSTNGLISNSPENFCELFCLHSEFSFEENLERLVFNTNAITGRIRKYDVDSTNLDVIINSVDRAFNFINSNYFDLLDQDLSERVKNNQNEIAIAALIDNVNLRGRIIEFLITDSGSNLKNQIIKSLIHGDPFPSFKTEDKLGDYSRLFDNYNTATDIKTKVMFLSSCPKGYNIDKLLEFLSTSNSVYMIYLIGIDENKNIVTRLCSSFDSRLLDGTVIQSHWAGRNRRGVTQFSGQTLKTILKENVKTHINTDKAKLKIREFINL